MEGGGDQKKPKTCRRSLWTTPNASSLMITIIFDKTSIRKQAEPNTRAIETRGAEGAEGAEVAEGAEGGASVFGRFEPYSNQCRGQIMPTH